MDFPSIYDEEKTANKYQRNHTDKRKQIMWNAGRPVVDLDSQLGVSFNIPFPTYCKPRKGKQKKKTFKTLHSILIHPFLETLQLPSQNAAFFQEPIK